MPIFKSAILTKRKKTLVEKAKYLKDLKKSTKTKKILQKKVHRNALKWLTVEYGL